MELDRNNFLQWVQSGWGNNKGNSSLLFLRTASENSEKAIARPETIDSKHITLDVDTIPRPCDVAFIYPSLSLPTSSSSLYFISYLSERAFVCHFPSVFISPFDIFFFFILLSRSIAPLPSWKFYTRHRCIIRWLSFSHFYVIFRVLIISFCVLCRADPSSSLYTYKYIYIYYQISPFCLLCGPLDNPLYIVLSLIQVRPPSLSLSVVTYPMSDEPFV